MTGKILEFLARHRAGVFVGVLAIAITGALAPLVAHEAENRLRERDSADLVKKRSQWFFHPRASANGHVPTGLRIAALAQRDEMIRHGGTFVDGLAAQQSVTIPLILATWTPLGPQPTTGTFFFGNTSGRVTALAVDSCVAGGQTVYVGAADGGVWKTTNGGAAWTPLTDSQASLATGSIALDPTCSGGQTAHVYVGTGEENFAGDNLYGSGVLTSTDGGNNWTADSTFTAAASANPFASGPFIGAMAANPKVSGTVLAAVNSNGGTIFPGLYESTNAGMSWSIVVVNGNTALDPATDVVYDPSDPTGNTAYAALGNPGGDAALQAANDCAVGGGPCNGVYVTNNGGTNWSRVPGLDTVVAGGLYGRISLGILPGASPAASTIYAAVADGSLSSGPLLGVFKGTNGGTTWAKLSTPDFCVPQCFYDMVVKPEPGNPQVIFLGGSAQNNNGNGTTTLFRSVDGGITWADVSSDGSVNGTGLHVDHHALAFATNSLGAATAIFAGNDGGVWSSTDVLSPGTMAGSQTWTNLNSTLDTTQFYPGNSIHPATNQAGFGGSQDNGTPFFSGQIAWTDTQACGDGGFTAIDAAVPSNVFAACQDADDGSPVIFKNLISGAPPFSNWSGVNVGIILTDDSSFIPPIAIDTQNPLNLYFGTNNLYQTTNGGNSWANISGDLGGVTRLQGCVANQTCFITSISVGPTDSNTVYAGTDQGFVFQTTNALQGVNSSFTEIDQSNMPGRPAVVVTDTQSPRTTAFAGFSGFSGCSQARGCDGLGHMFFTNTSGRQWTNFDGNLPDVPVNDIVVDPADPTDKTVYAATDAGVFATSNVNGVSTTWSPLAPGLPNVEVLSLKLRNASRTLWAGTHGRGVWALQLPNLPATLSLGTISPVSTAAGRGAFTLNLTGTAFTANSVINFGGAPLNPTTFNSTTSLSATVPASAITNVGPIAVTVTDGANTSNSLPFTAMGAADDFSFGTPSPSTQTVSAGTSAMYTIPLSPVGATASAVELSCSGLPQQSECTFSTNPALPAAGGKNVTVTISTTRRTAVPAAPFGTRRPLPWPGVWLTWVVACLLGLAFFARRQAPRRSFGVAFALVTMALLMSISACGTGSSGGPNGGTPSSTNTITITGASGQFEHSANVTLVVQ